MISTAQIVTRLVEATGAATAYFHRLLNDIIDVANAVDGKTGVETVTPDGSGLATIAHGYAVAGRPATLSRCVVQATGTTAFAAQLISVDADELTVKLFDMAGAAITTGSYDVAWKVSG